MLKSVGVDVVALRIRGGRDEQVVENPGHHDHQQGGTAQPFKSLI